MHYKKVISFIISSAIILFLIYKTGLSFNKLSTDIILHLNNVNTFLIIAILISLFFVNSLAWHYIMKSLLDEESLISHLKVWAFSNLARYIPGGIWQYGGRIYLSGNAKRVAVIGLVLEFCFSLIAGGFFSLLLITSHIKIFSNLIFSSVLLLMISFCIILLLSKNTYRYISKVLYKISKHKIDIKELSINKNQYIPLFSLFLLQFIIPSLALFFIINLFISFPLPNFLLLVSIFSFSWLIGYLSFFSPGGLGVQEATLATLLSSLIPFPVATSVALLYRLLLVTSEIGYLLILILLSKKFDRRFL